MALVAIHEQNLIDIGNALRNRVGELSPVEGYFDYVVVRTNNATGFDSYNGYASREDYIVGEFLHYTVPNAVKIVVKISYQLDDDTSNSYVYIMPGIVESYTGGKKLESEVWTTRTLEFQNTDSITLKCNISASASLKNIGFYAEIRGYDENDNIISYYTTTDVRNQYKPRDMAQAINNLNVVPDDKLILRENIEYKFANNHWNWFIDIYGDKITTKDLSVIGSAFRGSTNLKHIPFELNAPLDSKNMDISNAFYSCESLEAIPKINNVSPGNMSSMFGYCKSIRNFPEDIETWFKWDYMESLTSSSSGKTEQMFSSCYSLRSIPIGLFKHCNPYGAYNYSYFRQGFYYCFALDELVDLPMPYGRTNWTSNAFTNSFSYTGRVKNITFALREDNTPFVMPWKSQTIDLTSNVGYVSTKSYITGYNSGITEDKEVKDDATYQALKDDPDWFTLNVLYSRYNHDSAVATINSLPDTSAYLASAGGTNTIKFKKTSGSKTDGGAIETLTAEEIAVATAKGWTVTLA